MNTHKALGLGSNVGDREKNFQGAITKLHESGIMVIKESSIYETEPVDCSDEAWFLNQVVFIETQLTSLGCLRACKRIEVEMGREPSYVNAPRPIDIDLLLWGQEVVNNETFTIPHKSIYARKFVLIPLLEIEPNPQILEWLVSTIPGQAIKKYK